VEPGVGFASGDRHTDRIALHTPGPRLSDPYGGADNHVNLRDKLRGLLVRLYARRVEGHLDHAQVPKHIGVIMDGNRRWAKASGSTTVHGHRAGAEKIEEFLGWCSETDVEVVTLWLLSTDNFDRPQEELGPLLGIIEDVVRTLAADGRWRVHHVGTPDLLPSPMQTALKEAEETTAHVDGIVVNVAIGYGGRQEIADAVRKLLLRHAEAGTSIEELAEVLDVDHIAEHLYTSGQPDPDLVIRTSGEQRLSGFLLWQSAHSEFWFCEAYWPEFRKVDFLRALRDYAARHRRFGG
jgi:short-chain Z-isoprenyl diphosphate synthase